VLLAIGSAVLFGGRRGASSPTATTSLAQSHSAARGEGESTPPGDRREVKIDVTVGQAEIYRGDELLGKTPFVLNEPLGTDVNLTLKQPGYRDHTVRFTITERKRSYSFLMEKE
jgi:hypothetical protein